MSKAFRILYPIVNGHSFTEAQCKTFSARSASYTCEKLYPDALIIDIAKWQDEYDFFMQQWKNARHNFCKTFKTKDGETA